MSEKRDNSGTINLTPNDKGGVETRPDFKGKAIIAGKDYWVSAWKKEGAYGKFFSLSFQLKDEKPKEKPAPVADFNDDIPW